MCFSQEDSRVKWLPLLASGRIDVDYSIIKYYVNIARELGRDHSSILISSDDLNYVKLSVENISSKKLDVLIDLLSKRFMDRIDPYLAKETYKRYLGLEVDENTAVKMLARVLAAWCVEAAETLGYLKIHKLYG
ncbi:MAG: hypothetical protein ABWJ42_00535 [Sulfolobales archaeon]